MGFEIMQFQPVRGVEIDSSPRGGMVQAIRYSAMPILATGFLELTGTGRATLWQALLALLLLQMAWGSLLSWKEKPAGRKEFPLFALVASMYWLAFGLPLFWNSTWDPRTTPEGLTRALALAVLGVTSLYCGMRLDLWRRLRNAPTLDLRDTPASPKYLAAVMLLALALKSVPSVAYVFGSAGRQVLMIVAGTVPLVAYAILLRRQLLRPVPLFERLMLLAFIGGMFVVGLASGWLGTGAVVLLVTGCVLLDTRFHIPKLAVILVVAYVIFLQPTKNQFRRTYWGTQVQSGQLDRAGDWLSSARRLWENALSSSNPDEVRETIYNSLGRLALLPQTANVMDVTPGIIPYQGWRMYRYLAVTLVPRALWPEKPSVNDANRFYQVTYGMTAERDLEGVSISVGALTEAYISFGWPGAIIVMMLVGVFLNGVSTILLSQESGVLMKGIGLGMVPVFIGAEAQMAQFIGGFLQQVLLVIVVMLPIVQVRRRRATPRDAAPRRVPVFASAPMGGQSVTPPPFTR